MFADTRVWVRGAGELGSGVAHLLHRLGFAVFMSEILPPLAIRRPVTFSDALLDGTTEVEGVTAVAYTAETDLPARPWKQIPVFEDQPETLKHLHPTVLIDARMIKHYEQDYRTWADLVIGLGPGFDTTVNCHRVIETMRGHDLARVITSGASSRDTGVPGVIGGESSRRIVRSPGTGKISWVVSFGDIVAAEQTLGWLDKSTPVPAPLAGIVRGLIAPQAPVHTGMKIGDVDPRGASVQYLHISEKARAIASGVLEAILLHLNQAH